MAINDSFWKAEQGHLLAILRPRLEQMAVEASKQAADKAGIGFNPNLANAYAARWARDYTDNLLKQLGTTSTVGIGEIIAKWVETPGATYGQLQQSLIHYGEIRAQAIAVTETTRAYAEGEEMAYKQEGITHWTWRTNRDELVCKICGPLNNQVRKIGDEFGKDRKGNAITKPPAHVNCRCWVAPVLAPNKERAAVFKPAIPESLPIVPTAKPLVQFVEAKNIKEANQFAKNQLGLNFVDYKGTDIKVVNEWNRAVTENFSRMPELSKQTKAVGSAQGMFTNLVEFHTQRIAAENREWLTKAGYSDEEQLRYAKSRARKKVERTSAGTYALSYSQTPNDTDGIFINNQWTFDKLQKSLTADVNSGWHPLATDSVKAVVDHEFGHQIDTLLNFRNNAELNTFYHSLSSEEISTGLSRYATKKKAEFVAEAWAEYLNNPSPRPIAKKVGEMIIKVYNDKYGK